MNETRGLWRGKRVDNGEWIKGFYSSEEYNLAINCIEHIPRIQELGKCVSLGVVPETLGECTGLTDKNGKLIFEGDIIRYKKHLFCIEWSADICSFTSRALDGANFMPCMNVGTMKNYEVIGNIHDNSELLPVHGEDGESNAR